MGLIAWIVVGAIAGFLASHLMRARESLLMMIVLGIVGGLVGGFVATSVLKMGTVDGINVESIVIATLGAIAVIFVVHLATGSRGVLSRRCARAGRGASRDRYGRRAGAVASGALQRPWVGSGRRSSSSAGPATMDASSRSFSWSWRGRWRSSIGSCG